MTDALTELANRHQTDKGDGHYFAEIYHHFFSEHRDSVTKLAEIGIYKGGSLLMWSDYFKNAKIYGLDINKIDLNHDNIITCQVNQNDPKQLNDFIQSYGGDFDIIIDDGSHIMEHQQRSFGCLFNSVKSNGYYIIEDMQTSLQLFDELDCNGRNPYRLTADAKNSTLEMITHFMKTHKIISDYMSTSEAESIQDTIAYCNLFYRNRHSITCIIKKK